MARSSDFNVVYAFLGGAAIGAGVALLFAPRSGKETVGRIKQQLGDAYGQVSHLPHAVRDAATRGGQAVRESFREGYARVAKETGIGEESAG